MRPIKLSLLLFLLTASSPGLAAPPAPAKKPDPFALVEPKIIKIDQKKNIHVVYDVKHDVWDADIGKGWSAQDLLPGVSVAHDVYTRIINLQQQGYSYIRF